MMKNYLRFPIPVTVCQLFFQEAFFWIANNYVKYFFQILEEFKTTQLQVVAISIEETRYSIPFNSNKK